MNKIESRGQVKSPHPENNVVLLTELLRTMLGFISAQNSAPAVSREIAKQMALAVRGNWALVCGWDVQTNNLSVWGEYKDKSPRSPALIGERQCRPGPALIRILADPKPLQLSSSSRAAKELSPMVAMPEDGASLLFIPIPHGNQQSGSVIVISSDKDRKFNDAERIVSQIFANHAAVILENVQLQDNVQRSATEIEGLRRDAQTDMLTGLPNRRGFEMRLQEELRRATRYSHVFSLVMIDLDNFKRINDLYGHHVGDVALQDIARCLRYKVRDTDFLARFGGDEFVLILPETGVGDALSVCDKLRAGMAECAIGWGGGQLGLTFSYGTAEFPRDAQEAARLVGAADKAMYGKKSNLGSPPSWD